MRVTRQVGDVYIVLMTVRSHSADFKVVPVLSPGPDEVLYGSMDNYSLDPWKVLSELEIYGVIKWDGCIDWATNEDCTAHSCSLAEVLALVEVFKAVYALAEEHISAWTKM